MCYIYPYIDNKYTRWYWNIIGPLRSRELEQKPGMEIHHITPKSLWPNDQLGRDLPENLVALTHREHFVVHWLLTKMIDGQDRYKMEYAFWRTSQNKSLTSKRYEIAKKHNIIAKTIERQVHCEWCNEWFTPQNHGMWHGKYCKHNPDSLRHERSIGDETRRKMSISRKGLILSDETRKKISKGRMGIKFSESHKRNIALSKIGKTSVNYNRSPEAKKNQRHGQLNRPRDHHCEICDEWVTPQVYSHYHGEKCKPRKRRRAGR